MADDITTAKIDAFLQRRCEDKVCETAVKSSDAIEEHDAETKAKIEDFLQRRCSLQNKPRTGAPETVQMRQATAAMVAAVGKRCNANKPKKRKRSEAYEHGRRKAPNTRWMNFYAEYADHINRNGPNAPVPKEESPKLFRWVNEQRGEKAEIEMHENKKTMLSNIGFDFTTESDIKWQRMLVRVSHFIEKHKTVVSASTIKDQEYTAIHGWMSANSKRLKSGKLTKERAQDLQRIVDQLGERPKNKTFWILKRMGDTTQEYSQEDLTWEHYFIRSAEYAQRNGGDANARKEEADGLKSKHSELVHWQYKQRRAYKEGSLSSEKIERLKSTGLDFKWCSHQLYYDGKWDAMYANLVEYQQEHGDCCVPYHYNSEKHGNLGHWVTQMRSAAAGKPGYKRTKLTGERRKKLENIGFDFRLNQQFKQFYDDKWNKRRKELIAYREANGGKDPPSSISVGSWCQEQRANYKKGKLDQGRKERLDEIGFEFKGQHNQKEHWEYRIKELAEYRKAHGVDPPSKVKGVGYWCVEQRRKYRDGELNQHQIDQLQEAGFDFTRGRIEFEPRKKMCSLLVDFYEENGHCDVAGTHPELATWISIMRFKKSFKKSLPQPLRQQLPMLLGKAKTQPKAKCWHQGCIKFASSICGLCRNHSSVSALGKATSTVAKCGKEVTSFSTLHKWQDVKSKVLDAVKSGKPVPHPKAIEEVDFEIDNPPGTIREPSEQVSLFPRSTLNKHDVIYPKGKGKTDFTHRGNVAFRELLCDTQACYTMAHPLKRRRIAKSLVFIVQKRGGRFFKEDGTKAFFCELSDTYMISVIMRHLGKDQNAVEIRKAAQQVLAMQNPPDAANCSQADTETTHKENGSGKAQQVLAMQKQSHKADETHEEDDSGSLSFGKSKDGQRDSQASLGEVASIDECNGAECEIDFRFSDAADDFHEQDECLSDGIKLHKEITASNNLPEKESNSVEEGLETGRNIDHGESNRDDADASNTCFDDSNIADAVSEGILPKAASEVYFDIENPPETFEAPQSLQTQVLKSRSLLSWNDVVFCAAIGRKNSSLQGNVKFKVLIDDFLPCYIMASRQKRRSIAKSLVFVVQSRSGKFFWQSSADALHELSLEDSIYKTNRALAAEANKPSDVQNRAVESSASIESAYWDTYHNALNAYIKEHGHPPQTREDNPPLYDWVQLQQERQREFDNLLNSC